MNCGMLFFKFPANDIFSYLFDQLDGVIDIGVWRPIANRVYISISNQINLISRLRKTDGFDCKWTMIPSTSFKRIINCIHYLNFVTY